MKKYAKLRNALVFAILWSMVFSIYGCNKNKPEETNIQATGEEETKIEFDFTPESKKIVAWLGSTDPEDPALTAFLQENPEFEIDNSVASQDAFSFDKTGDLVRLSGAVASGEQPDLFLGFMSTIEAYYSNLFMPIHDFLLHDPEYNFENNDPNIFNQATFNGLVYFLPYDISTSVLVWNKELFESVGLDPEKGPSTWTEFSEYNKKLITYDYAGNIKTIGLHGLDWRCMHLAATGEQYTDETGMVFNFDNDKFNRTMEYARSFVDAYGGDEKLPQGISFWAGNAGMGWSGASAISFLNMFCSFKYNLGPHPKPDDVKENYAALDIYNLLGIPKTANNPRGAWKLGKYLMTDAKYAVELKNYEDDTERYAPNYIAHIPTREKVYKEFKPFMNEDMLAIVEKRDKIMQSAELPLYHLAVQSAFNVYFNTEFNRMLRHEISPKDMLKNAQSYIDAKLKEFKEEKIAEGWIFNDDGSVEPPKE